MLSICFITIPVLLDTVSQAPLLFHSWVRVYHHGHQVLPTAAVGTFILYIYASIKKRSAGRPWGTLALAGLTTLSMLPFTWLVMVPTNDQLFGLEEKSKVEPLVRSIDNAQELVIKWTLLHLIRSTLPLMGAVIGAVGTFRKA